MPGNYPISVYPLSYGGGTLPPSESGDLLSLKGSVSSGSTISEEIIPLFYDLSKYFPNYLHNKWQLRYAVNGFWIDVWKDKKFLKIYLKMLAYLWRDVNERLKQLVRSDDIGGASYRKILWKKCEVKLNGTDGQEFYKFDGTVEFDYSPVFFDGLKDSKFWVLPAYCDHADFIYNSMTNPTTILVRGVDFQIIDRQLYINKNHIINSEWLGPGADSLIFYVKDLVVHDRLTWKIHGIPLDLPYSTSHNLTKLIKEIIDIHKKNTGSQDITKLLYLMAGSDSPEPGSVVRGVYSFPNMDFIDVGDQLIRNKSGTTTIEVGDIVPANSSIGNSIQIGSIRDLAEIIKVNSGIKFLNKDLPLARSTNRIGVPVVEFQVSYDNDVNNKFWSEVRRREIATGNYLSDAIDKFATTVNPVHLLDQYFLKGAMLCAKVGKIIDNELFNKFLKILDRLLPIGTYLYLIIEPETPAEVISLMSSDTLTCNDGFEFGSDTFLSSQIRIKNKMAMTGECR
jgi:hypothetical protein